MIIDQLPTISNVQNSDELPIERGQTTYKTTVGEVVGAVSKIVADEYDNTSTYAVGNYCVYEGTLYVCNTAISTAEEWNASHWTATNVTDEIPTAYTSNPAMDGTASPGSTGQWADGGHVHPHDTSKQDSITATGMLKGAGSGSVSAAVAGTDYLTHATNYSPLRIISTNYSLAIDDIGKTISVDSRSGPVVVTLSSAFDTSAPNGTEVAIMKHYGSYAVQIDLSSISGARYSNGGSPLRVTVAQISDYEMVALKKLGNGFWILFGNVEVVT